MLSPRLKAIASLVGVVLLVVLGALLSDGVDGTGGGGSDEPSASDRSTSSSAPQPTSRATAPRSPQPDATSSRGSSGLPTIDLADLPAEAQRTIELIERGGPFPEPEHDGTVFHNYEGLLPDRRDGYYREYTVPTPGLGHRGPRRIVEGEPREWYWTDDHYASFAEVLP